MSTPGDEPLARPSRGGLVIAVDCSTTAAKVVVVDRAGVVHAGAASPLETRSPRPGWHEQDAASWWPATARAIREAVGTLERPEDVVGLCITHQRESFACVDSEGVPLGPAILWHDARAHAEIAELGTAQVEALSGKPADITPGIYKIAWVARNDPARLTGAARVVDTHALLVHALTGRWVTSTGSADPLGLVDMRTGAWSDTLLAIAGVRRDQLPELVAPGEVVGTVSPDVARDLGLSASVVVVAGLGDGQAAGLGAGVVAPGTAYLNLGTAVLIGTQSLTYEPSRAYRTLFSAVPGQLTLETFQSAGTYLPTWFRQKFGKPELAGAPDPELEAAAAAVPPGSSGLLTLPYWNAAQAPHWDPLARGAMVGWTGAHGPGHAYRSLLEGVAFAVGQQLDGLEAATIPMGIVRTMGGGSRSALWTQILLGVLARPLQPCAADEVSALGAAILAQVATGGHPDLDSAVAAMVRLGPPVDPDPVLVEAYAPLREIFAALYPHLRPVLHQLAAYGTEGVDA